jgi:hypothetical protein
MQLSEVIALVAGLAGLVTGLGAYLKSRGESRAADASAGHSAVDAAGDALALVEKVYESRIKAMEADIAELQRGRETDRHVIIDLNRRVGNLMQAGEMQSAQIKLWRERVEELLFILRTNKIQLPTWAQPGPGDPKG